jgi:hypothetical protein
MKYKAKQVEFGKISLKNRDPPHGVTLSLLLYCSLWKVNAEPYAMKLVFMILRRISKKWTMPIRNWEKAFFKRLLFRN